MQVKSSVWEILVLSYGSGRAQRWCPSKKRSPEVFLKNLKLVEKIWHLLA